MEKKKYRLKGHESFVPREGWLTKGLTQVAMDSRLYQKNSGADALGVGTNMAKSIRYWMKTAGFTKENSQTGVILTPLGEVVRKNDVAFEELFTLWIAHANIVSNFELATSWNLFFNRMNVSSAFTRDELANMMRALLLEATGETELSERSVRDDCSAILSMYANGAGKTDDPEEKKTSPFSELGLLGTARGGFMKKRPSLQSLDELAVLYTFVEELNEKKSLPIDYLADGENMPGNTFYLTRIAVNHYLDKLQAKGFITVNRTAGLDIIYPDLCDGMTRLDVVKCYYGRSERV